MNSFDSSGWPRYLLITFGPNHRQGGVWVYKTVVPNTQTECYGWVLDLAGESMRGVLEVSVKDSHGAQYDASLMGEMAAAIAKDIEARIGRG